MFESVVLIQSFETVEIGVLYYTMNGLIMDKRSLQRLERTTCAQSALPTERREGELSAANVLKAYTVYIPYALYFLYQIKLSSLYVPLLDGTYRKLLTV